MKTKILVVALACFSVGAVAQQSSDAQKPAAKTTTTAASPDALNTKGTPAVQAKGGKMAEDSWDPGKSAVRESPTKQNAKVSAGDVNGDGMPDKTAGKPSTSGQNTASSNAQSNGKSPVDLASGHPTGKRQHEAVSTTKSPEAVPNNK